MPQLNRVIVLAGLLAVVGCGSRSPAPTRIDEGLGTYRGVGIGDRPEAVVRVFGRKPLSGTDEPVAPVQDDFVDIGGATVISAPRACKSTVATLRYDHVSFLLCGDRVYGVIVAVDNARTRRGIAVGDDLDKVRRVYPSLSCGEAPYGEGAFGRQPSYPYCGGKLRAGRWIWFGRDPVRSITISTAALRT